MTAALHQVSLTISCGQCASEQRIPLPSVRVTIGGANQNSFTEGIPVSPSPQEASGDSSSAYEFSDRGGFADRSAAQGPPSVLPKLLLRGFLIAVLGLSVGGLGFYAWDYMHQDDPADVEFIKTRLETLQDASTRYENATRALAENKQDNSVAIQNAASMMVLNGYADAITEGQARVSQRLNEVDNIQKSLIEGWGRKGDSYLHAFTLLRDEADKKGQWQFVRLSDAFIRRFQKISASKSVVLDDDFTAQLLQLNSPTRSKAPKNLPKH